MLGMRIYFSRIFLVINGFILISSPIYAYLEDKRPLQSVLNEILEKKDLNKADHNEIRRQLDFGSVYHPPPQSWHGRWFPDSVTSTPAQPPTAKPNMPAAGGPVKWSGSWFPYPPDGSSSGQGQLPPPCLLAHHGGGSMWQMINSTCDDGKTNLTVDWNGSFENYTCTRPRQYIRPDFSRPGILRKDLIPKTYRARHECMKKEIHYSSDLPTFGTHRPAWPKYGEYKFLPKQRWLHTLEHGGIVMLYHPCAHPQLVKELRELVVGCLRRHVISAYNLLDEDRPLALLSWGSALLLSVPQPSTVISFIQNYALRGPETTPADGQFSEGLINPASTVTDLKDSTLCPLAQKQQVLF